MPTKHTARPGPRPVPAARCTRSRRGGLAWAARRLLAPLLVLLSVPSLSGCGAGGPATVEIAGGEYARAFEAARGTLRDYSFTPERIDAARGIMTTELKPTSGLATPWDPEQTDLGDELSDLAHQHARSVRVVFLPPGELDTSPDTDLRSYDGPLVMHVLVPVYRLAIPGFRPETESIAMSSYTFNPALPSRGVYARYPTPVRQDDALAARVAQAISRRLASPASDERPPAPAAALPARP